MYFPFLRGNQSEMIAVLDLKDYLLKNNIIPIIEPVKDNKHFKEKMKKIIDNEIPIIMIVNPVVGDYKDKIIDKKYINIIDKNIDILAYQITEKSTLDDIKDFLNEYEDYNKSFIHLNEVIYFEDFIRLILRNKTVKYHFMVDELNLQYRNTFKSKFKKCIIIKDGVQDDSEDFTDIVFKYKKMRYSGFSDYHVIGKNYREESYSHGISPILYTVIENDKIKLKRYSTNDTIDNKNKKLIFLKMAGRFYGDNYGKKNIITKGSRILMGCYHSSYYPGPAKIRQASIEHHIEFISKLDNEKYLK